MILKLLMMTFQSKFTMILFMQLIHKKRFLLKSDLELFSQYRLSIDDHINTSEITFFNVVS